MYNSYHYLRYDRPRIINDSSVHDLELVKKGLTVKFIRDHMTEGDIIKDIVSMFEFALQEGPINVYDTTVMKPLENIREQLEALDINLRNYQDSIKMDSQFYL